MLNGVGIITLKNWDFPKSAGRDRRNDSLKRVSIGSKRGKSVNKEQTRRERARQLLQLDSFTMKMTAVFQKFEDEAIWIIDQSVRDKFNARSLHKRAVKEEV